LAEFWRTATGVVMAGNSFGFGPSGSVLFKNPSPISLAVVRSFSTLRVGSDFSGPAESDALEANYLAGMGAPIIRFHGSNANADQPARVSFRGNVMTGNLGNAPWDVGSGLAAEKFYGLTLAEPAGEVRPVIGTNSTVSRLDVALADPTGLAAVSDPYPQGSVQSIRHLKQITLDATFDGGAAEVDLTGIDLSATDLRRVLVSASYALDEAPATDASPAVPVWMITTPFSATLGGFEPPATPIRVSAGLSADGLGLTWSGGQAPYTVQVRETLIVPWRDLVTTSTTSATVPLTNTAAFFRIGGQ
jgi:hypothetical protein